VIDFIMKYERLSKHEAIEKAKLLAGAMGIAPTKSKQPEGLSQWKDTTAEKLFA